MSGTAAEAMLDAAPRPVAGIASRRVEAGGEPAWVFYNPATGRYFQASPPLYLLAAGLDGRRTVRAVLARLTSDPAEQEKLLAGLSGMLSAGLLHLPGLKSPPAPSAGPLGSLRQVAFTRIRMGDLARVMPIAEPLLGWLFTRTGLAVLVSLLAWAGFAWSGRGAELAEQGERLSDLDAKDVFLGYLVFIVAKLLHELGHAVAARRMAAAEGHRVGVIPWGISFMFLMPAPYVDASSSWFLESRWRRAVIGMAGVATDLLVAAVAALIWSAVGPGVMRDRLFDLVVICGVSSLLFNLNPLARLDGYYVMSDLLGVSNLQLRAQAGLGRVLFGHVGLASRPRRGDLVAGIYAVASWTYRWTIYLGIFWIAGGVHWMLAFGVGAIVLLLFLLMPALRLAKAGRSAMGRAPWGGVAALLLGGALAGGVLLLPLPFRIEAEGVVVEERLVMVYPRADGLLLASARPGPASGAVVLRLENPETERMLAQLQAEEQSLAIELRRARASGIVQAATERERSRTRTPGVERVDAELERARAVASQIRALEVERAAWEVRAPEDAVWEPLRAATLTGSWLRRDDGRPLGVLVAPGPAEIRLVLDQWDGPAAMASLAAHPDASIPMRLRGASAAQFQARPIGPAIEARDSLPSPALATAAGGRIPARADAQGEAKPLERVFELRLRPEGDIPLHHGARVQARIALAPAPLAAQLWRRARQALQRRLAV
jgi:putative peptide zinc metalloprotease protein